MNYCSRPLTNYRQNSRESELLPRLFTPNKVPRIQEWVLSGPRYEEKLAILQNLLRRQEEREATRKVMRTSFHPQVVPHVEHWLQEAREDERRAIMRLFRTIASDPTIERAVPTVNDESKRKSPVHIENSGKTTELNGRARSAPQRHTSQITMNDHFPDNNSLSKFVRPTSTQHHYSKKVHWHEEGPRPVTAGGPYMASVRTEFDIFPDWRGPHRTVVPMTQVPYRVRAMHQLPKMTKHACTQLTAQTPLRRDFVIHPEWITP